MPVSLSRGDRRLIVAGAVIFAALVWSPWGVPTGAPRTPEVIAAYRAQSPRREG